ncbi:MAG: phage major capsid protein [Clostridia bacterium]|nr:phage major capsid protein [Clostridia bacterium]
MAINLTNADNALKSVYLGVIAEQLNLGANPFLAAIEKNSNDVYGNEVRQLVSFGVNGGIGAGTEDGNLPSAAGNNYKQFVSTLKNLYGVIEISDKAIRASETNSGAFVNLLNAEMEGLIKSSRYNLGRMLFGDGSGELATVSVVDSNIVVASSCQNLVEGMVVDFIDGDGNVVENASGKRISAMDRETCIIKVEGLNHADIAVNYKIVMQGSYNKEITGLKKIFDKKTTSLYGLDVATNAWLKPYRRESVGALDEITLQTAIDNIEDSSGNGVNFIMCSYGVRRAFQSFLSSQGNRVNTMELAGGYKALSYNGIPVVADKFCPSGTMYLLNTNDFCLHQLCDWQWLTDDDGKALKQVPGKPVYTATLVKYAELICSNPIGQGILTGIMEC